MTSSGPVFSMSALRGEANVVHSGNSKSVSVRMDTKNCRE